MTADPKKILELKQLVERESQRMQKYKKWVYQKKNIIADTTTKISEEESKRLPMGS